MFGVSFTELVVIFLVALVLFGPDQLPQIARQIGKLMGEVKKGSDAIRREFYNTVYPPAQELKRDFSMGALDLRTLKNEVFSPPSKTESTASNGLPVTDLSLEKISSTDNHALTPTQLAEQARASDEEDNK